MIIQAVSTVKWKSAVMPQTLSKRWGVGIKAESDTIKSTTHIVCRTEQGIFFYGR